MVIFGGKFKNCNAVSFQAPLQFKTICIETLIGQPLKRIFIQVQLFPSIKLLEEKRRIVLEIFGNSALAADLGVNIPNNLHPYDCLPGVHHNEVTICIIQATYRLHNYTGIHLTKCKKFLRQN